MGNNRLVMMMMVAYKISSGLKFLCIFGCIMQAATFLYKIKWLNLCVEWKMVAALFNKPNFLQCQIRIAYNLHTMKCWFSLQNQNEFVLLYLYIFYSVFDCFIEIVSSNIRCIFHVNAWVVDMSIQGFIKYS